MSKLVPMVLCLLLLPGCFGGSGNRPKVIIVESDNTPYQLMNEEKQKVRMFDTATQTEVFQEKAVPGYFAISPSLYKKLVRGNLKQLEEDNK